VASFAFVTCAIGLERLAKADLAARRPAWRLAFSRPGLLTFKTPDDVDPAAAAPTPFARVWGASLGTAAPDPAAFDRVHVFARDPDAAVAAGEPATRGDRVLDVVTSPGEPPFHGHHVHTAWRSPHPGGAIPVDVPPEAPSRAYAKIAQAIALGDLPVAAGHTAVEIGSAPGGAALALAHRGVHVVGVDTGHMAPAVLAYRHATGARVEHLATTLAAVRWEDLPARVDWLLVDVNLAPQVALHELARLVPHLRSALRGAVITLKVNDLAVVADLPKLADRIAGFGFAAVHLAHLPANRQELCAIALR
jgi:23S rRNA (cytidine2498-2'-O)-methyltransferase